MTVEDALLRALASADVLLVLDNCEHVRAGAAKFVSAALHATATVRILATSREALRVHGEQLLEIAPLAVPDLARLPPPAALARIPAVQLFVERWRARDPTFRLTKQYSEPIADICVRLDGLPLAIELAAAQPNCATPAHLLARLGRSIELTGAPDYDGAARHRSVRAVERWSYELLDSGAGEVFRRLGVFGGGFTATAAEAVVRTPDDARDVSVIAHLEHLRECHLVTIDPHAGDVRYRMLEPVREYALEQLAARDEAPATRARHAQWCAAIAEAAERGLWDERQPSTLDALERELANIRAALAWCRSDQGDDDLYLRIAVALRHYWDMRGPLAEAHGHYQELLSRLPRTTPKLAYPLLNLALDAIFRGEDIVTAAPMFDEALVMATRDADPFALSVALSGASLVAYVKGLGSEAAALAAQSVDAARESGIGGLVASAVTVQAAAKIAAGDLPSAEALLSEAQAIARASGDRWTLSEALRVLGNVRFGLGDLDGSRAALVESLPPQIDLGDRAGLARSLKLLGVVFAEGGDSERAAMLIGAADALADASGVPSTPSWELSYDRARTALREALGDERLDALTRLGAALSLDAAISLATDSGTNAIDRTGLDTSPLTSRELDVVRLVASGSSNGAVARSLGIAPRTAAAHVEHVMTKLGVHSRAEIGAWAQRTGLVGGSSG